MDIPSSARVGVGRGNVPVLMGSRRKSRAYWGVEIMLCGCFSV